MSATNGTLPASHVAALTSSLRLMWHAHARRGHHQGGGLTFHLPWTAWSYLPSTYPLSAAKLINLMEMNRRYDSSRVGLGAQS